MATASPTQLYEKVSEVEALSRYDHLNGQIFDQVSQEEALSRNARQYGSNCEKRCFYSYFRDRTVCDWYCPRNN